MSEQQELFKWTLDTGEVVIVASYNVSFARPVAHRALIKEHVEKADRVYKEEPERMDYIFTRLNPCHSCGESMRCLKDEDEGRGVTNTYYECPTCSAGVQTVMFPPQGTEEEN